MGKRRRAREFQRLGETGLGALGLSDRRSRQIERMKAERRKPAPPPPDRAASSPAPALEELMERYLERRRD